MDKSEKRFNSSVIQAGRGIAAMLVVFYHASSMYSLPKYGGVKVWGGFGEVGRHGVDFFFVLSGFIIFIAHRHDIGRPDRLKRYISRRFVRIYPVYWIYLTGFLALVAVGLSTASVAASPIDLLSSYSLIRLSSEKPPLWVAWTLFHEIVFYGMFAFCIFSRKLGIALLAAWACVILVMHGSGYARPTFWTVFHDAFNLEFFMGIAAAYLVMRISRKPATAVALFGFIWLITVSILDVNFQISEFYPVYTLCYGLGFAFIILGAVALEMNGKVKVPIILQKIGESTFSLYLAHSAVASILLRIFTKFDNLMDHGNFVAVLVAIVAAAISVPLYWIIEKPVLNFLRVKFPGRSREYILKRN